MKRFNLFRFVFALVCGCHIIGVKSYRWSWSYLDPKGICPPFDDQSPVVKIIPGHETCGARHTSLWVTKYESIKGDSLDNCQKHCQSDKKCASAEYNKKKEICSFTGKESFGTFEKHIVTGYDECPKIGECPYVRTDYGGGSGLDSKWNVNSPQECQKYCREKYGSNAVINYGFSHRKCVCKKLPQDSLFTLAYYRTWISGPTRCPQCFGYKTDLSNLPNVYNGSPNPSLIKDTVEACQKSCKENLKCKWFEFNPRTGECRHKNPLTARINEKNTEFASRDCNRIFGPPFDDQSPVVKIIPGLETCGARGTSLWVRNYKSIKGDSLKTCQLLCQSDTNCALTEFDKNNEICSFTGKKSFGTFAKHIVTGHGKCPKIGKCPYVGVDYAGYGYGRTANVNSPKDCQTYCRRTYGSNATINYGFSNKYCYCKYAFNFKLGFTRSWISGPLRCHPCFGYKTDLSNLPNVYNGSPNPSLIKDTVEACQKSCEENSKCEWFEFDPWTGECLHKNPLTARMNEKNTEFASRDCNRIFGPPYDDQSPVVKIIPGLETCGARGTSLRVRKYKSFKGDSVDNCQKLCQSHKKCAFTEFDKNNKICSFTGKKSFGTDAKHIVTGYDECPKTGECPYVGTDYGGGSGLDSKWNVNSPQECQKYCREKYGSNAVINYGFSHRKCVCKKLPQDSLFTLAYYRTWISGPTRCPQCLGFKTDLSNLPNVYNGSPNPSLIKPTVKACQKSCKENLRCKWFEFNLRTGECRHKNPLTARINECNATFASRDCNWIVKGCRSCNQNGLWKDSSCGLLGDCRCNQYHGYTGPDCYSCLPEYYEYNRRCYPCKCDRNGSKGKVCHRKKGSFAHHTRARQCPCKPRYNWYDCSTCVYGFRLIKGICCSKSSEYNLKGSCTDCDCYKGGSKGTRCTDWNNNGNCYCRYGYKGRRCYDVGRQRASWTSNGKLGTTYGTKFPYQNNPDYRYMVLKHECTSEKCDLRYIGVKSYGVDVDMWGSTEKWDKNTRWWVSSGKKFCNKESSSKDQEICTNPPNLKEYDKFYLVLFSRDDFSGAEYEYELGNYYVVSKCKGFSC